VWTCPDFSRSAPWPSLRAPSDDEQPEERSLIDLHSHILHGIDDGARTLEDSLDIARAAVSDGITVIAGTPHVRDDWPTDPEMMERGVAELRSELERAEIPLDVRPGGEIAIEWLSRLPVEELRRFGLGGNPNYLLVETPYYGWPRVLADLLFSLRASGIRPVLAHPERNGEVQARPQLLVPLVQAGVLVQVTAASLDGRIGRRAQQCGLALVDRGLAHLLASDAHHASIRAVGMAAAVRAVGGGPLAAWLTWDVPAAIVDDLRLPPRPETSRRGGLLGKLFTVD
jgi:protein-tyrosine phosphatase